MTGAERQPGDTESDSVEPGSNHGREAAAARANGAERDDLSFPPVDFDVGFFSRAPRASHESVEDWGHDTARRSMESPSARRRRAQLKKYVSLAMGLASAVCLAALVKGALTNPEGGSSPQTHFSAAAERVPLSLPEPVAEQQRALQPTAPTPELAVPAPAT